MKSTVQTITSTVYCKQCNVIVPLRDLAHHSHLFLERPLSHKDWIDFYELEPSKIESGMRIVYREFSIKHNRIDLVGKDKDQITCLIEVELSGSLPFMKRRMKQYRLFIRTFLMILGLPMPKLRCLGIFPRKDKIIEFKEDEFG